MSMTKTQIKERAQLELLHCLHINENIFGYDDYNNETGELTNVYLSESEKEAICGEMQKQTTRIAKLFGWSQWELERFA